MYDPIQVTLVAIDLDPIEFPNANADSWLVEDDAGTRYYLTTTIFTNLSSPEADEVKPGDRLLVTTLPMFLHPVENDG